MEGSTKENEKTIHLILAYGGGKKYNKLTRARFCVLVSPGLFLRSCLITLIKNAFRNTHLRKVFEGQEAKNWTLRSRKK